MAPEKNDEDKRALRIINKVNQCHLTLDSIYEGLVDRDFESAKKDIYSIITELKYISKSIDKDDF